jgi:2',3'-cyclic-nucleotide 2'-phosphodiesterase (5'-nucleotidase family)
MTMKLHGPSGALVLALALFGCESDPDTAFTLQLLHFADVDGNEATALDSVDEFSALVAAFRADAEVGSQTLMVSSGDNLIPGPRYFAAENGAVRAITGSDEPGHVDHLFMNEFGVAASALGNHDLDQGPGELFDAMQPEDRDGVMFPGALFPYLASNVDFSLDGDLGTIVGADGTNVSELPGLVAGSAVATVAGETIGLVGVSTPELTSITSTGALALGITGSLTPISELAAVVQPAVDALTGAGVDKIIVLAHLQQIDNERALAQALNGVDIIVAGGSNARFGDRTDRLFTGPFTTDTEFSEDYPFETNGADGNPTLIVNVDGDYTYLGRLVVGFDEDGVVIPNTVDEEVSGAWAAVAENVTEVGGTPIARVVEVRDAVQDVITEQFENVIGHTDVYLDGRRSAVRTQETNLGNLTSDAIEWYAENCAELTNVIVIKNGGGIRSEIGNFVVTGETPMPIPPANDGLDAEPGDVSEGHLRGTLRFDNGLTVLDVTGEELKTLLEHGVAQTEEGATPGRFPQVAGIWFGFDPSGTAQVLGEDGSVTTPGTRVTDIWVDTDADGTPDTAVYTGGAAQAAATETFTLVTLNFLANGGDGYPFDQLANPNRRQLYTSVGFGDPDENEDDMPDFPILTSCDPGQNTTFSSTGGEQDALAEYFLEFHPDPASAFDVAETAPADDRRIQDLSVLSAFVAP